MRMHGNKERLASPRLVTIHRCMPGICARNRLPVLLRIAGAMPRRPDVSGAGVIPL